MRKEARSQEWDRFKVRLRKDISECYQSPEVSDSPEGAKEISRLVITTGNAVTISPRPEGTRDGLIGWLLRRSCRSWVWCGVCSRWPGATGYPPLSLRDKAD